LKPEVRKSRWRRQTGCKYISAPRQDSKEIPTAICMFLGVRELNNAVRKAPSRNRKSDIQDGGCQTGSTCILASMQDGIEIPEGNPMSSGSENSMALLVMLCLETGSQICKIAAAKPEVRVSQLL
jgi:hypothetical protein